MRIISEHLFVYPGGDPSAAPVLKDLSLTLEAGTVTLLVGRTGSGKTTLLHALAGLIPLHGGSVRYGDEPLWLGSRTNRRVLPDIGMVFQNPENQLFAESLRKEFRYSLRPYGLSKDEIDRRAQKALRQMGLSDSFLNESVLTLSEGQKRRAALAVTWSTEPQWLLLDEPTAGMDPGSVPLLLEAVEAHRRRGGGVLVVSHDLDTFFPAVDRVLLLADGAISWDRTPEEWHADPLPLLHAQVGLPASIQLSLALRKRGIVTEGAMLQPAEAADTIIKALGTRHSVQDTSRLHIEAQDDPLVAAAAVREELALESGLRTNVTLTSMLNPAACWLAYLLVTTGMLLQSSWYGLMMATAVTMACFRLSGVSGASLMKPVKPLLWFMLLSVVLSGMEWSFDSWPGFSWQAASLTLLQLSRLMLVSIMGLLFARTLGFEGMRKGLEQSFSYLERIKLPAGALLLYATLLLRFVPQLFREIARMSMIIQARGKIQVKPGSIRLRDLPAFMVPLLLSMLKQAEQLALALESRGLRPDRLNRSLRGLRAPFTRYDRAVMLAGALLLAIFILFSYFLP